MALFPFARLFARPSVRPHAYSVLLLNRLSWNWQFEYFFRKSVVKIQFSLKYYKNKGYIFDHVSPNSSQNEKCLIQNCKAQFYVECFFFRKSCLLWDNVEKYSITGQATDDHIIRRTRFTCCITKATKTHSDYVVLNAFPREQWFREHASQLCLYVPCCLVILWRSNSSRAQAASLLIFLDHTQLGTNRRTSLSKWSTHLRGRFLHNTTNTRDEHPSSMRDSKPQSQVSNGRTSTPETARPPESALKRHYCAEKSSWLDPLPR